MKFKKFLNEKFKEREGHSAIDGMTKQTAKNAIYKATKKCTHNKLYKDSYWQGPKCVWDTFEEMNLNWSMDKTEYQHEEGIAVRKVWYFTIYFDDKKGKLKKLVGYLTASGAGSVKDPLDKYDLVLIIT